MCKPEKWPEKDVPFEFREPHCGVSLTTASESHQGTGTNELAEGMPHCSLICSSLRERDFTFAVDICHFISMKPVKCPILPFFPFLGT